MNVIKMPAACDKRFYSARCRDCQHRWETPQGEGPEPTDCPQCRRRDLVVIRGAHYGRPRDVTDHRFRCAGCGRAEERTIDFEQGEAPDPYDCPDCGGQLRVDLTTQQINRYGEVWTAGGYFNRGLGEWVTSESDVRAKAAERGLVPIEGDLDIEGWARKTRAAASIEDQAAADHQDRLQNDPAFRGYRIARDQGQFDTPDTEAETGEELAL